MSFTIRLALLLAATVFISSCIAGDDDDEASPTALAVIDTPSPTLVANGNSEASPTAPTVEASPTPSATQDESAVFITDDPDRQPDYPYPIPTDCPVTPVKYGKVGENGRPGYWMEVAGVWAGQLPGPLYAGDNKVLWETLAPNSVDLTGNLINHDDATGEFTYTINVAINNPSTHPSILTFSESGCWNIDVTTNEQHGSMTVYVFPDQYQHRFLGFLAYNISQVESGDGTPEHPAVITLHIQNTGTESENLREIFIDHMSLRLPSGDVLPPTAWTIGNDEASAAFELDPAEEADLNVSFDVPPELADFDAGAYLLIESEDEGQIQIFLMPSST